MRDSFKEWIATVLVFILVLYVFIQISYLGMEDFMMEGPLKSYMNSNLWHLEVWLTGIFLGSLYVLIQHWTKKQPFRKRSFGFNILVKSLLYLMAIMLVGITIYYLYIYTGLASPEEMDIYRSFLSVKTLLSIFLYFGSVIFLLNFFSMVQQKLGPDTLTDLLTGKYHHPRNVDMVFMFLDLQGSTSLAESMGHHQYSRLLRECMHELTPVVQKYQAKIYQYVGDEVVLYWNTASGFDHAKCIEAFYNFSNRLKNKGDYFRGKYQQIPVFKAGMDTGTVTATEIGDIKREIAFHGDVLNTAARLEEQCNAHGVLLIVSRHVVEKVPRDEPFTFNLLSDLPLKGKMEQLQYYGVSRK